MGNRTATSDEDRAQPGRPVRPALRRGAGALSGVLAAAVALGVAELVAAFVDTKAAPVVAVGSAFVDATPQWLKQFAIDRFGTNDKLVLLSGIVVVLTLLALVTGACAVRRGAIGLAGVGALGGLGAIAAQTRPVAATLAFLPSVVGALVGAAALQLLLHPVRQRASAVATGSGTSAAERISGYLAATDRNGGALDRRAFLLTSVGAAVVAGVTGAAGRAAIARRFDAAASRAAVTLPSPASPARALPRGVDLDVEGLSPFTTPNGEFYRVDTALVVPQITTDSWSLRLHGMVDKEIELGFDELLARRLFERDITLTCVSNEVGGPYVGTARWLGAPLAELLREAGVHAGADQIVGTSADGMTIGTPTAVVMDGRDALLAVGMNGAPLPPKHGFPVRMVVPGLYGYVSATKWLVDLEVTTFSKTSTYWVRRGWARKAPIKTMSRIDTPTPLSKVPAGRVPVAGVAWAQHRGIDKVEVRVDGGAWHEVRLARVPSTDTWAQWVWQWDARPGQHTLEVRATDRAGHTQTQSRTKPFPSGATGWQSTVVTVA